MTLLISMVVVSLSFSVLRTLLLLMWFVAVFSKSSRGCYCSAHLFVLLLCCVGAVVHVGATRDCS